MPVYSHEHPVCGPHKYYGREMLLRSLLGGLKAGRSYLLCGGPKTGRTSTLEQVVHSLEQSWVRDPAAPKILAVRCAADVGAGGSAAFVRTLWSALLQAVGDPRVGGGRRRCSRPPSIPQAILGRPFVRRMRSCGGS